ncbi:MAG TPA: tetratricopeptide repeat protein, partial [Gemmataceae bacterium]
RATPVIATGNFDYGIRLLLSCCKLDPANLIFRQALRRTEKTKYKNNLRGSWHAWLSTFSKRARAKAAKRAHDYLRVLEFGEEVLARNPWDTGVQMDMAEAADVLGLLDLAIWTLEQARHKDPRDVSVNRTLARLYEKRGNFTQAIALWEMVRKESPADAEAANKSKDLAANETIARGNYQEAVGNQAMLDDSSDENGAAYRVGGSLDVGRPPATSSHASPEPAPQPPAIPLGDRTAREAAPLRARILATPTDPDPYLQLAVFYRRANELDQAREILELGLAPTGNRPELAFELADLEIEPFRRNLSVTEAKLHTDPQNEELRKIRIRLLKEINTRELELFRQKADRYPAELAHRFEMGVRLLRANQIDEAIHALQTSRHDARFLWRSLLYLGYCFKSRNNWRLARRNFEQCLQSIPMGEDAARKEVLFQLAQGNADAGDLAAAVDMASELANLDFTYRSIGKLLDAWQVKLQQDPAHPTN